MSTKKMEEKIVYRRKNLLLGKNRVPPPLSKKGAKLGF